MYLCLCVYQHVFLHQEQPKKCGTAKAEHVCPRRFRGSAGFTMKIGKPSLLS